MQSNAERPVLRVSVIVPTYNRAGYLAEALQSIAAQTRQPDEVLVVDDGSTEDIHSVVRRFGDCVHHLRHDTNRGVAAARNTGLAAARGDVVAWLDSDDLWEPDFLAHTLAVLDADETIDGVYTGLRRIDAQGELLPQASHVVVAASHLYSALVESCFIQTSTFVARRGVFDIVEPFDTSFQICEDYDMLLRLAKSHSFVGIPGSLVRYRVHGQNTVANTELWRRSRLALAAKHFGQPEGPPDAWSVERRRAHGFAYLAVALRSIQSGEQDTGWSYLERAARIWPELLNRLDTFYELACGEQPMGHRGTAELLDIRGNGTEMICRLGDLFAEAGPEVLRVRRSAYSQAHLALAALSDQAGEWQFARRCLLRAIWWRPVVLGNAMVVRRLAKLYAGKPAIRLVRSLQSRTVQRHTIEGA